MKGSHWVFIVGFICVLITSIWNTEVAMGILSLLFLIGVGVALFR